MLQRIQTLYLIIAFILGSLTFFLPVMHFATAQGDYSLDFLGLIISNASGNEVVERLWIMSIIAGLIPLISLITINLYKHRTAQIRISIFNILLMLGYYAIYFFF